MKRKDLVCSHCGSCDFEVGYATDCSRYEKGGEKLLWELSLCCNDCGFMTILAYTNGQFGFKGNELDLINEESDVRTKTF